MVRTMYDFQDMRIRASGRLRIKADETPQDEENMPEMEIMPIAFPSIVDFKDESAEMEKHLTKAIDKFVKREPIWDAFLDGVKGIGTLMAAVLLSEVDIERAHTVSSLWLYAGMAPCMVPGKVREAGKGKEVVIKESDSLIRADRLARGYVSPYNLFLKKKMLGVLATCFLRSKSPYSEYYYNYKFRLEHSERITEESRTKQVAWQDATKSHRHAAALRYMMKMFLRDLYVAWRTIEGLPVRAPYQEEYLGHTHHGQESIA